MAFPLRAEHLRPGDLMDLWGYPEARKLSPKSQWAKVVGIRADGPKLRIFFFFGGDPKLAFQVLVDHEKYFQVERKKDG